MRTEVGPFLLITGLKPLLGLKRMQLIHVESLYFTALYCTEVLCFRPTNYIWYRIIITSYLTLHLESLGRTDRSLLGLTHTVEFSGIHISLPVNHVYLLCALLLWHSKLHSEYVTFPLSQKHIPVGACTTAMLSVPTHLLSRSGICSCYICIILTYPPQSTTK